MPTSLVMVLGAASGVLHTYFVSRLGGEAIAAVSLVFPLNLVMITLMGGGVGAGVSSAVAQALGAGRRDHADAVAAHALWITFATAAVLTLSLVAGAPVLFEWMGGEGEVLAGATRFARVLFGGAVITFTVSTLDSILRGSGNVRIPTTWATVSISLQIIFTPIFMFSLGLGLPGAAAATLAGQLVGAIPRARYFLSSRAPVSPRMFAARISPSILAEILRVGIPASLGTLTNYLGLMVLTAIVARYGTAEIAGFGLGTRLDFLIVMLAFGVGSAVLTLVGLAVGAGSRGRARAFVDHALWGVVAVIGAVTAVFVWRPAVWLGLFTADLSIQEIGAVYLRTVGPTYPFIGASMVLGFAFQGLGRAMLPMVLVLLRTALVVAAATAVARAGGSVRIVFGIMAAANVVSTLCLFWSFRRVLAREY